MRLDDDELGVAVPAERHGADPELLGDRRVERVEVLAAQRRRGRDGCLSAGAADDLVEQRVDALGEDLHLLLLQRHRDHARAVARLKEELPLAGLAHGAGDEPLRLVEEEDLSCHVLTLSRALDRRPRPSWGSLGPAPPPTTASDDALRLRRLVFGGGASEDRSPPVSLVRSTNGRRSV